MKADTLVYEKKNDVVRLAILDSGRLVEFDTFDKSQPVEGNVYLGRLTHKLELSNGGIGFKVNIGDTVEGFLNVNEFDERDVNLSEGQSVVVQVSQEKHAEKGAKLVRNIQLVGTTVVYKPLKMGIDISKRITDSNQLRFCRSTVFANTKGQEGWAVRTDAVQFEAEVIAGEMEKLRKIYEEIRMRARSAKAPSLLYFGEDPLFEYIRRYKSTLKKIVTNNHVMESDVRSMTDIDVIYDAKAFETYGLEDQIVEALNCTSSLKSGGKVYIEQTLAGIMIDVDSNALRAGANIYELNNEAALEIARQIRLKNLSGKIIIDFAGNKEYQYMKPVIDLLETELADDPCRSRVLGLSKAGNIEILRQRRRPSLIDMYTIECPTCQGTGRVEK